MEAALGSATSLLGKVFTMLSDNLVAAYVDSLELGHNSEQIKAKLVHTQGLLQIAQLQMAQLRDVKSNVSALKDLLENLSRMADEAENSLNEIHYFRIYDRIHGTNYATTQEAGDLGGVVRHQALHARSALHHSFSNLVKCFSCSKTEDGDEDSPLAGNPRGATASATLAGNPSGATASGNADGDALHFDRVSVSRKIKSVLHDMQSQCDFVSNLLGKLPSGNTASTLDRPQVGSTVIQDTLYGRQETFEKTINRIISGTQTVSVLPIVGPGGIGKTTLAQHIYNDSRIEKCFDVRIWVCVSTDCNVPKITKEILGCIPVQEGASSRVSEISNFDQLQREIMEHLKFKRFLIVLDDIWKCDSEDGWKTLLAPFRMGEVCGSMVLFTTRFPKLAEMMRTVDPLELTGLGPNDFITFFEVCIFGEHQPQHYEEELADVARKIAPKLKGSPLAAKTVGRLLQKNLSLEHWNEVLKKHEWLKQKNEYDIMPSLKISYNYLPFDLKKCFSYFGLYPEDHRFVSSEMNRLFVACGITDSTHQDDRNYLEELVDNGFLMKGCEDVTARRDDSGSLFKDHEYYVMHDLMHELSKIISTQECFNISDMDFRADVIPQSVRHISITIENRYDGSFEEEMYKLRGQIDISNLRTLMIFKGYGERISQILKDTFKEIKSLRVLFTVVNSPESFPHRFSKLIHLQYLKISSSDNGCEMSLPSTLSRFYHLKFLDLNDWHGSPDLPDDFSHLENLHDFSAKSELHSNIRNVGKIKHLRSLTEFSVKKEITGFELSELGALTELEGKLSIRDLEHVATKEEATAAKLILKRNLKELRLLWNRDQPTTDASILDALQPHSNLRVLAIANNGATTGPSWLCLDVSLISLETLDLEGISWSTFPPFGKLPNLKVLNLKRISGMHQFDPLCGGSPVKCFVRLKLIGFHDIPELAEWIIEPNCHSFPSIEIIKCVHCPNLCLPSLEVYFPNLSKLEVFECPKISLPCLPHTSTLTNMDVGNSEMMLLYHEGTTLIVEGYGGALAFHKMDKLDTMNIEDTSHISLADIERLKALKKLCLQRCEGLFPEELDGIVLRSVQHLLIDESHLTSNSWSKVLNCFPALSSLEIQSSKNGNYDEECVMQLQISSSLRSLRFSRCRSVVIMPMENGGIQEENGGIQEENSSLQSLQIFRCARLLSRWPMGERAGGAQIIYPFPASLRELYVEGEPGLKSMDQLSNLTSLTSLTLVDMSNLTMDGLNPLIAVNLKKLEVYNRLLPDNTIVGADLLLEVARTKLVPAGSFRLEVLKVDNISEVLVAPICNLLAPTLHELIFYNDERTESFMEEQERALQLLASLRELAFLNCSHLLSLPQGLHRLSSLEFLIIESCPRIQSMPKEGLPVSLTHLLAGHCSAELVEQIKIIKSTNLVIRVI